MPGGIGVRIDSHCYAGYKIPPYYDSMIAKLIVHGSDRREALERCSRALNEFVIDGVKTTIPFSLKILQKQDFKTGNFDTGFIERMMQTQNKKEN